MSKQDRAAAPGLPGEGFTLGDVIRDRGSRYAVSGGRAGDKAAAQAFLTALKRDKKFAKATHNSWALLSSAEGPLRNDDGESGAAALILKMLEREALQDQIIVVTRWYGGVHLGGDRFAHVTACVRAFLEAYRRRS
ncbi:YigZ family protein [Pseudogemmobacter faecipullorum]|uniref:YigZ family protein n=1 Tax=Pseudogemmobacter faecipullorum TaxID=2755041 RepID=A0ABS8CP35_9RHOB|nr:YigZ family protein [Pseudogemmobacter faecipullorum]MCB5411156.1 YigZ family protein [Pseudogemmobacter faecipullorum]